MQIQVAVGTGIPANQSPTAIDLFAGCGGMSLGMKSAGMKIVFANEVNDDAALTYAYNFPHVKLSVADVKKIDLRALKREIGSEIDIIAAGLPCQGFSMAGRRQAGDPRNRLFIYLMKFVEVFRPKIVVIENVKGMLLAAEGAIISRIRDELAHLGYSVHMKVLSSSDYGVPQKRERVFIIATAKDIPEEELFPPKNCAQISVKDAISDLAFLGVGEKTFVYKRPPLTTYQKTMRKDCKMLHNHESPRHSAKIQKRFAAIPIGTNGRKALRRTSTAKHTYYKMNPMKPCRTITTLPEDFVHYKVSRIPTVRELARLQSFPDDFVFLGPRTTGGPQRKSSCPQYTQVGNAVPPLLAEEVFKNLARILEKYF